MLPSTVQLLCGMLLNIILHPVNAQYTLKQSDIGPMKAFLNDFIQPYLPFIEQLVNPKQTIGRNSLTPEEQEIESYINKKVDRVKPKDRVSVVEIIKQRTDDMDLTF